MKAKIFSSLSFAVLFLLVLTSFASALTLDSVSTLSQSNGTFALTISDSDATITDLGTLTYIVKDSSNEVQSEFTSSNFDQTNFTGDGIFTINYTIPSGFEFEWEEEYTLTITAIDNTETVSKNLSFTINTDFCTYDGNGFDEKNDDYLDITSIDVSNNGFGDEENWYPFDEIEVSVTVKAPDSDVDINDVTLEWGLYDKHSGEWVIDVDEEDDFDLDGGDKEVVSFTFQLDDDMDVDLEDLDNNDLVLYIRVTGKADSDEVDSINDEILCWSDSLDDGDFEFTMDKFILLDNIQVSGSTSCGDEVQITADIWNIDGSKQKDITLVISNKELGINKEIDVGDIKGFDSNDLSTTITIPTDADEKKYTLTFYIYDDDGDLYEIGDDDDQSIFYLPITLDSCSTTPTAVVSASLQSEAKAGKDLMVKATITNTGSESKTFLVSASSYTDWASSASLDKTSITLAAGQSTDVLVTLKVLSSSEGENGFDIELVEGSKFLSQPVPVTIEKSSSFPNITGFVSGFGDNAYLYGILALNLILIAGIIFVAIRLVRKKSQ